VWKTAIGLPLPEQEGLGGHMPPMPLISSKAVPETWKSQRFCATVTRVIGALVNFPLCTIIWNSLKEKTRSSQVYNIAQVILNVYMIWGLAVVPFLPKTFNIFGINAPYTARVEYFVYIHYLSKFLDFFDTVFIILRGKDRQQLSFLHVYHHASIGMIWGTLLYIGHGNGTAVGTRSPKSICGLLACSTHLTCSHGLVCAMMIAFPYHIKHVAHEIKK
jgi:hypothetical protein